MAEEPTGSPPDDPRIPDIEDDRHFVLVLGALMDNKSPVQLAKFLRCDIGIAIAIMAYLVAAQIGEAIDLPDD